HDLHPLRLGSEDRIEFLDERLHFLELLLELLDLEAGELREAHVEDRLGLLLGELEAPLQLGARRLGVGRAANDLDDRVDVVDRDLEALEDVFAFLRLAEIELRATHDHVVTVRDEVLEHLAHRHDLRDEAPCDRVGHEREHDHAERALHRGVLVQLVQHYTRYRVALQLDYHAHAVTVRFVAQVGDSLEFLLAHQVRDLLDETRLVHLIGELGDDDLRLVALLVLLDRGAGAHDDLAAPRLDVVLDPGLAVDVRAGREIGAADVA